MSAEAFDPARGEIHAFAASVIRIVERRFVEDLAGDVRTGFVLLRFEHEDEAARQRARQSERDCADYLVAVRAAVVMVCRRRGQKLQNATDHADEVLLRVLECLRGPLDGFGPYLEIGQPSWWRISDAIRSERRRRDRVWLVKPPSQMHFGNMLPADLALEKKQLDAMFAGRVDEVLRPRLSKTQRRYLDAIIIEIQLAREERLTDRVRGVPARVAERLGKDPAQVSRAIKRIARIARELGLEEFMHLSD